MDNTTRQLLIDAWRRGRAYFLLAATFSLITSIATVKQGELSIGAFAITLVMWANLPQFLSIRTLRVLHALPISDRSIGRFLWWCTCGGCAIVTAGFFIVAELIAYLLEYPSVNLRSYLYWMLIVPGLSGQALALIAQQVKPTWRERLEPLSRSARTFEIFASLHFALTIFTVTIWKASATSLFILVVMGYVIAAGSYKYSEHLAATLLPPKTTVNRREGSVDAQPTRRLHFIRNLWRDRDLWSQAVLVLCAVIMFMNMSGSLGDLVASGISTLLGCIGILAVSISGLVGVERGLISLKTLRALPLSVGQLSYRLMVRAIRPVLLLCTLAVIGNLLLRFSSTSIILLLTFHLASLQTLWPALALNQFGDSATIRIMAVLGAFVWAIIGGAAIIAGRTGLMLFVSLVLGVCGYLWTRHTLLTNSFAYRSHSTSARDHLYSIPNP